ncbi:MAG: hypothetical protein WCV69_02690 [Patescibacteria group bacterium]|jgi:hypothetical protein
MPLSPLQKYIIKQTGENTKNRLSRNVLAQYYSNKKKAPSTKLQANIITKSLERLINQGYLVGFGQKTQYKLFITHIKLTPRGKKIARKFLGQQAELPIFKTSRIKTKK